MDKRNTIKFDATLNMSISELAWFNYMKGFLHAPKSTNFIDEVIPNSDIWAIGTTFGNLRFQTVNNPEFRIQMLKSGEILEKIYIPGGIGWGGWEGIPLAQATQKQYMMWLKLSKIARDYINDNQ